MATAIIILIDSITGLQPLQSAPYFAPNILTSWHDEFIYLNDDETFSFVLTSVKFTIFILVRWISLSVVWKKKWICNMPATHRGRVTHICATKLDHPSLAQIIGLSPVRRQAIIWTNAGILWNGIYGTISIEILIESRAFSFKKHFKMSPTKLLPFISASVCQIRTTNTS